MNKKASIKFELVYTLEDLRFMIGEQFPEEQFEQVVSDYAIHDIMELLRTEDLNIWSTMEITDVE